jgi:cell division protein FtsZ
MTINLKAPELRELKPRIIVCGVGGGGCNAVNNMIASGLSGVDFLVANTDAQALMSSRAERVIQMGLQVTEGLGAGAQPEVGRAAAEEAREEILEQLQGAHMCFVTAGMGGGTGTGAAPVIAQIAREMGILTVGVVTKPFNFEGQRRLRIAEAGIAELQSRVDTLIVIPNQNLFRIATERTTFADAFAMADQVLYSGVASVTDLMVKEGLINLDFADVRSIMRGMGKAMMGTGEASGDRRAILAAEAAIANPLLDEVSMRGARGLLISITGGHDLTLYEVDEAASRIRQEVDEDANIILGATFESDLEGVVRVSVVATGIDPASITVEDPTSLARMMEAAERMRHQMEPARVQPSVMSAAEEIAPAPAQVYHVAHAPAPAASVYAPSSHSYDYADADTAMHRYEEPEPVVQPSRAQYEPAPVRPTYGEAMMETAAATSYSAPVSDAPRAPRMPQIEDFPRPVQEQLRQQREAATQGDPRRKSIFERLASFGASRQEDEAHGAPVPPPPPPRASATASMSQPSPAHAEFAKRPQAPVTPGGLDAYSRRQAPPRHAEEDHLEIPAFLRRQSGA